MSRLKEEQKIRHKKISIFMIGQGVRMLLTCEKARVLDCTMLVPRDSKHKESLDEDFTHTHK